MTEWWELGAEEAGRVTIYGHSSGFTISSLPPLSSFRARRLPEPQPPEPTDETENP